jgi:hypothetical protein
MALGRGGSKRVAGDFVLCKHRDDVLVSDVFLRPIPGCFTLIYAGYHLLGFLAGNRRRKKWQTWMI